MYDDIDDQVSEKIWYQSNQGNSTQRLWFNDLCIFVECTGVIMGSQVPLMIIDRRVISIMSLVFLNCRVIHLGVQ
jgi:hypothetical protein